MQNICIFEDDLWQNFLPLTTNRPAYDLLVGMDTLYEKVRYFFPAATITLHSRAHLKAIVKQKHPQNIINNFNKGSACLFINSRALMDSRLAKQLISIDEEKDYLFTVKGNVIAAHLTGQHLETMINFLESTPSNTQLISVLRKDCMCIELEDAKCLTYLWDLITLNNEVIKQDFADRKYGGIIKGTLWDFTCIYNENDIFIDKGSTIESFVVLNAEKGPIYIGKNVYIEAHSRLEGPLFIGDNSRILGGKITSCSIGPNCKVHGEISNSVLLRYSNKAHDGFIGHAYLGEWVNLGAMTTNSNLKNTYGEINLDFAGKQIKTGQNFLGAFLGDYTKTAIGTLLNTGTIAGFGATILGAAVHDKFIPNFAWGEKSNYKKADLAKLLEVFKRQMQRRNQTLSDTEIELFTLIHQENS